jgi:hypothetical protein
VPAEIEQRLAALELPLPDPAFEQRLRAALARPARRRSSPGRVLAVALLLAACTASAAAFGASQVDNDRFARLTHRALVSHPFRVNGTSVAGAKVAVVLDCRMQGRSLACTPLPVSASEPPQAYRLVERAGTARYGPTTLWMFATGPTIFSAVEGLPPLVACPQPSVAQRQICAPLTAGSVLPRGTPIYENVTRP